MRRWLLIPLVASLFGVSFWESWSALTDAAKDAEIPHPGPWPHAVDGFILACALLVVEARRTGHQRGAWWPRLGLLGATALSTGIQGVYAPDKPWAWALHAWSPLAVLFSFECGVWLMFAKGAADPKAERASGPPLPARAHAWLRSWDLPDSDPVPAQPEVVRLDSRRPSATPSARPNGLTATQRRRVETWVAEGRTNKSWMARELGLSDRGRKHLGRLVDDLLVAQNGERPKEPV